MQQPASGHLTDIVRVLRHRVTHYAYWGLAIAILAIAVATVATVVLAGEPVTLANLYSAQTDNVSLLVLDFAPFLYALWGQYVGVVLSHEAGAMVLDETQTLRTDRAALREETRRVNERDALTGLANRRYFIEQIDNAIADAYLSRSRLGLLVLDLDGFSEVNDQFGAADGDRVLKSVAQRLTRALTDANAIARLGDDVFGVLFDPVGQTEVLSQAAWRIQESLEPPCTLDGLALNLRASIGGSIYPDNALDAQDLLNAADRAMQQAKTGGGGFNLGKAARPLQDAAMHSLSAELRAAIDKGQLVLYLQPIVDKHGESVRGVEALVRWQHPRRGLISPGLFIPRAERNGLIPELSNWVLRRALQYASELNQDGTPVRVSVNLSARSLLDPEFPDILAGLLAAFDLPGKLLVLEITEDTLMSDQQRTLDIVTRVANMGVAISIDDFGTGYSQLAYLKRLPVSEIKIDRSFINDMLTSETDHAIVKATIGLAHALRLNAVGEGIESAAQHEHLRSLGCDLLQGFHIGRPMTIDTLRAWLAERRGAPSNDDRGSGRGDEAKRAEAAQRL